MKKPHTSTFKGKRVYIRLKNGIRISGKFVEKTGRWVIIDRMEDFLRLEVANIKSFSIYKNKPKTAT